MAGETILGIDFVPLGPGGDGEKIPAICFDSKPPMAGQWDAGDRCYNTSPVSGGPSGWICITSGYPGVWTTFPEVIA